MNVKQPLLRAMKPEVITEDAPIRRLKVVLVEDKAELMGRLGKSQLLLQLDHALETLPEALAPWHLELRQNGTELAYGYDVRSDASGVPGLLRKLDDMGFAVKHMQTKQSSLEEIFVSLVSQG